MLALLAKLSLGFGSMGMDMTGTNTDGDPGFCVCGNYPLYSTMNGAGSMGHCMSFFGTATYMPHHGIMGGDCSESGLEDHTPAGSDCSSASSSAFTDACA